MRMYHLFTFVMLSLSAAISPAVFAADIASDVRQGTAEPNNSNGGYFEIGVAMGYREDSRVLDDSEGAEGFGAGPAIGFGYRWSGLFAEASQGTFDGLNLGYNVWSNRYLSIDFLASSFTGSLTEDDDKDNTRIEDLDEDERNDALIERDTFYSGAGIRVTAYIEDHVIQYRLITDTHGGNGVVSTLRLGRNWQIRNWNLHSVLGVQYNSASANDYWFGVDANEATERFSEFKGKSSINFSGEVGLTYPISENWVFRSFARYISVPDEVRKSPLTVGETDAFIVSSISYVF